MTNRRPTNGSRPGMPGDRSEAGPFPLWLIDWARRYTGATVSGPMWAEHAALRLTPLLGRPRSAPFKDAVLRYTPLALLRLDDDGALIGAAAQKLQNADLILMGLGSRGELVLQAADFKFRLIFADPKQVSADSLRALLTVVDAQVGDRLGELLDLPEFAAWKGPRGRGGALLDALLNAEGRNVTLVDGAFIAPESGQDRAALAMRSWPNGHLRVIWMPAGPREIFSGLPGAALLETLAAQDGHADPYSNYDLALNYYEASCGALAMLMELTTVPGVKHSGFDRQGAAAAFAPVTAHAAAGAPLHALPSVRTLAPLSPEADAHRRVRSELEGLLHLPMRLRGLGDLLARQGERIVFSEGSETPPGAVSVDAARDALRAVTDAYRAEMLQALAALGASITANDVPRLTRRAESLRMTAQEQALARLRALAAAARRTSVEASAG